MICAYCNQEIYLMDYKPTGDHLRDIQDKTDRLWAADISGDPNDDFICPAREATGRWPNGKRHSIAKVTNGRVSRAGDIRAHS
mgnify:CR=1 FL=1